MLIGSPLLGKAKDTAAKISIMQNHFPCINPTNLLQSLQEWPWKLFCSVSGKKLSGNYLGYLGGGGGMFKIYIRAYDFVYVFLASFTLILQHNVFQSIKHLTCACMWSSKISLISHTLYYCKILMILKNNFMRSHTSYRLIILYLGSVFYASKWEQSITIG